MSNYFRNIVGNVNVTERLSHDIDGACVPHAFILEGAAGSGRHTIATTLAAALSCKSKTDAPCMKCSSCLKIFGNRSPDIIRIGLQGERATVGIDAIRSVKSSISIAPNDINIKMYIIEDAEKMTVQAQNAFLLSLEEPPQYVIFALICENSSALLETVKSRAPIFRTEVIDKERISHFLTENDKRAAQLCGSSKEEFDEIISASGGSIGKALSLLDAKERKKALDERETAKRFVELSLERSHAKVFDMISSLGTKRPDIISRLELVKLAIRDLVLLKRSEHTEMCFYSDSEYAAELSARFTLEKLLSMDSAVDGAIDALTQNSNIKLTLMCMVYEQGSL